MAGGLVGLLDDVAALAKLAAASIDDVGAAAGRASAKAAGVVVDDTAVTPRYVEGIDPRRELPIIRRIATGSIRNKLLFILPAILLMSQFVPWLLTPLLMLGGTYLPAGSVLPAAPAATAMTDPRVLDRLERIELAVHLSGQTQANATVTAARETSVRARVTASSMVH